MAPITLGIRRTVGKNRENDRPVTFYEYGAFQSREVKVEIWASNFESETSATLAVRAMDLHTGWNSTIESHKLVTLGENRSTELWTGVCPEPTDPKDVFDRSAPSGSVVIHATLEVGGEVVARMSNWPEPYKLIEPIDPGLSIKVEAGDRVVVKAEKPVKGLWMDVEGDAQGVVWGDNAVSTARTRGEAGADGGRSTCFRGMNR